MVLKISMSYELRTLWNRAAHRADQRRSACCESRDSVSGAVEVGARRRDRIRMGCLREQSQGAFLSVDTARTQTVAGRDPRLATNGSDYRPVLRSESGGFVMRSLRRFLNRVVNLATRRAPDERLREEIEEHIALQTAENLRAGLSPVEARRQAMLKFGSVEAMKQDYRAERGLLLIENLVRDVRFALRLLRRTSGLTAFVVITLALGIGLTSGTFSMVDALIFRPYPVPHPSDVVTLASTTHASS